MFRIARYVVLVVALATFFCCLSCRAQTGKSQGELRQFRDRQGRAVQAQVLKVSGDEVTIKREDGRTFTVPLSFFSETDQEYIRGLSKRPQSAPAADNWPCFRGPGGMGVSDATGLPLEWDESKNVAWKTPLPGSGASTPITFGDHIYVTCYSGYFVPDEPEGSLDQLKRHLVALRRLSLIHI